jgi:hypothetical protein
MAEALAAGDAAEVADPAALIVDPELAAAVGAAARSPRPAGQRARAR